MPEGKPASPAEEGATSWTRILDAHDPALPPEQQNQARQELVERYGGLVRRYLSRALRNEPNHDEVVEDLAQEFNVKVLDGKLRNAHPDGGRFRAFVKRILSNLVSEYHRKKEHQPAPLGERDLDEDRRRRLRPPTGDSDVGANQEPPLSDTDERRLQASAALVGAPSPSDEEYEALWREDLILWALRALAKEQPERAAVLKWTMDEPAVTGQELAQRLSAASGRAVGATWVAKQLFEARKRLRQLIRLGVRCTLEQPTEAAVEEELAELGLLGIVGGRPRT
jgi:RNA polymerase sigma factor (sigma-70 family)